MTRTAGGGNHQSGGRRHGRFARSGSGCGGGSAGCGGRRSERGGCGAGCSGFGGRCAGSAGCGGGSAGCGGRWAAGDGAGFAGGARLVACLLGVLVGVVALAEPAGAHGVGGRRDLPLPAWQVAWGAGVAVLLSFGLLALAWPRPRLPGAARGHPLPPAADRFVSALALLGRAVALAALVLVVVAGLFGSADDAANVAPVAVYVAFWVGVPLLCALVGDVWPTLNPLDTLVRLFGLARRSASRGTGGPVAEPPVWLPALGLGAFAWLELAYHEPSSPRLLGVALAGYVVVLVALALRHGRGPAWLARADGFAVLFTLIGRLGPLAREPDGRWRLRPPLSGLATAPADRRTLAVVVVALGSTTFDGVSRLPWWSRTVVGSRIGWERTLVNSLGLVWTVVAVGLVWLAASRLAAVAARGGASGAAEPESGDRPADRFAPSLVPIALAYALAHYFSLLVFEGQNLAVQLSDPLGRGWNLFGTGDWRINYTLVSTTTIAWVQAGAIVVGHVMGVVVAHDRAVERYPPTVALRTQYPYLAVMVAYTVVGLLLLLGA